MISALRRGFWGLVRSLPANLAVWGGPRYRELVLLFPRSMLHIDLETCASAAYDSSRFSVRAISRSRFRRNDIEKVGIS